MTLDEYRAQHPEYKAIGDQELADALYSKVYAGKIDRAAFDKAIGLISPFDYAGNVKAAASEGLQNIKKGISSQTIEGGAGSFFPQAPIDIAKGALQIATSPVTALSKAYGGAIEAGTGGIIPADQAEISLLGLGARPGAPIAGVGPRPAITPGGITRAGADATAAAADKELGLIASQETGAPKVIPQSKQDIATLADVAGTRGQDAIERLAQTPGAARAGLENFLTERQKGQLYRISDDLKGALGVKRGAFESIEKTVKERNAAAVPAYNRAYTDGDFAIWDQSPLFERLASAQPVRDAMASAVKDWELNAVADGYGAMNPRATVEGGGIIKFKNGGVPAFPNLQFWDYTKQAIDKMIAAEMKPDGTFTRRGANLTKINKLLTGALDDIVPTYGQARQSWGGKSEYLNAINFGKTIKNIGADEWAGELAGMNDAQKEGVRIGLASELLRGAGNNTAELADITKFFRSPEMRQKISAAMPNQEAAVKWDQALNFEINSSSLVGKSLRGSQTARRTLEAADAAKMAGDLVFDMFAGGKTTIAKKLLQATYGKVRDRMRTNVDTELAKRFMSKPTGLSGQTFGAP